MNVRPIFFWISSNMDLSNWEIIILKKIKIINHPEDPDQQNHCHDHPQHHTTMHHLSQRGGKEHCLNSSWRQLFVRYLSKCLCRPFPTLVYFGFILHCASRPSNHWSIKINVRRGNFGQIETLWNYERLETDREKGQGSGIMMS